MARPSAAAIELLGITKRFGSFTAIGDLSLTVPTGTTFGLLGPNGAGKTTLIKMMIGSLAIDAGRAIILGSDIALDPAGVKSRVGYVAELPRIYPWMKVDEAIWFVRNLYPVWNGELCRRLLQMFDLPLKKRIRHLSRGTTMKLTLVLALAHDPELLILDEPMTGLDPIVREEFLEGVLDVTKTRGVTLFFSSHTIGDVERLADEIGILRSGKLLVRRAVKDIRRTKRVHAVLSEGGQPGWQPEGTLKAALNGRDWQLTIDHCNDQLLERLRSENPIVSLQVLDCSLEDFFKDFVRGAREGEGPALEGRSSV